MILFDKFILRRFNSYQHLFSLLFLFLLTMGASFAQQTEKTQSLFDGKSLEGWKVFPEGYQKIWQVKDSLIIGGDGINTVPENNYLYTEKEFEDFEFRCLFRITGDPATGMINSGIQYRSFIQDGMMIGYQADFGDGYWGGLYDEHRRGQLVVGKTDQLDYLLKPNGWNSYTIRVEGNRHQLFINGVQTVDYIEKDSTIPTKGVIAVQNHSGGNSHVEFKFLTIIELP